jgi:hypothetical protein
MAQSSVSRGAESAVGKVAMVIGEAEADPGGPDR